jgi:hypothetical protein
MGNRRQYRTKMCEERAMSRNSLVSLMMDDKLMRFTAPTSDLDNSSILVLLSEMLSANYIAPLTLCRGQAANSGCRPP